MKEAKWKFITYTIASALSGLIFAYIWIVLSERGSCSDAWDVCMGNYALMGILIGNVIGAIIISKIKIDNFKKAFKRILLCMLFVFLIVGVAFSSPPIEGIGERGFVASFLNDFSIFVPVSLLLIAASLVPASIINLAIRPVAKIYSAMRDKFNF